MSKSTESKERNTMVRIPNDLAGELDAVAVRAQSYLGVPGAQEVSRSWVHHLALRAGLEQLKRRMNGEAA